MSKQIYKKNKRKLTKLVRIDAQLHKRLKIESATLQISIGQIIEDRLV